MRKTALTMQNLKKMDNADMLGILLDFPQQCLAAQEIGKNAEIKFTNMDFNKIVFAGLGGSAIGADLVRSYLYFDCAVPITVLREYVLPGYIDSSTLLFVASYSGNTEETLSAYAEAKRKGATIIALSSGGKLKEQAQADNITFIEIPRGLPPRCALGYQGIIPLVVLSRLGIIKEIDSELKETIRVLEELRNLRLRPQIGLKDNIAKSLAVKLVNKFAVIYSASVYFEICATRIRAQLAENSKALSSSHVFPEMNHNEIVGWEQPRRLFKDFIVVMLRDKDMHPRVSRRMEITADILRREGVKVIELWSQGDGLLTRIFSLVYTGDFVSYYLAILYGIDPTPVDRVTYLKNQLAKD
ncbi:MAG: bifunctional phosphoglucose/phosphomannose isomerase [Candidatus Omnitrophica bacterium]|nr:bifunctional phosphoglucose/phosphomannose isomerase [Candidatus Omnitrophota bacterium]